MSPADPHGALPDVDEVLATFHPAVAAWVREQFDAPTQVQLRGWDAIGRGEHVLLGAPTGSGKTLAAFLSGIDQLFREPEPATDERLRLLYLSPLRALNYDIERNLRAPLQGIRRHAEQLGLAVPEIRVGVRTGDTPQSERQRQKRTPPDILITTPESLYVMLTSGTRELFDHVRWTVVDEIHALASNKRGTHLAFTLERLAMRVRDAALERGEPETRPDGREFQRIGLSATQRPIERIAAFMGGVGREITIIDSPGDKQHDLQVVVPVEDMTAIGSKIVATELEDLDTPTSNNDTYSIWGALHSEILDHVEAHTSTIVFVNSRRLAERLATALNELAARRVVARHVDAQRVRHEAEGLEWTDETQVELPADLATPIVARAHHGSISRETRTEMEELLKAGQLPSIVATSSLELGIDMGAVDLVLLVESPRSVASGLQRIGRAGHNVGDVSRGRIYPKHRADLVEAAAVTRLMQRREIEPVHVPELCLDVLAQQVVATCAERAFTADELLELTRRAWPWRDISEDQFHNLLSLLAGYFPVDELADIKARVTWDRETGEVRTRSDAARVAITNAGTIPDRGLYGVFTVGGGAGSRVGELDEEMVHETRLGDVIVLGSSSWRVEEITRDRVMVSPQPGAIGKPPFWHGEGAGRTVELGRAVGELVRVVADASPNAANVDDPQLAAHVDEEGDDAELVARLGDEYLCDRRAARNLIAFVREQIASTGAAPDDRTIVIERFRDELGDWRVCILTPFGKPVHAPWAMAIEERLLHDHGLEATALWSDDGIALRLPDIDELPPVEALLPDPDELEDLVVAQVGGSALFASRFREVATRALVLPLSSFRKRSPLWLQRLRAADVLRVAQQQSSFPMILETYREIMRDVFSLPDLRALLQQVHERSVRVVEVETRSASPMAASLLFDYTAAFLYDGDQPAAERRAQALSLDQALLRELLGTGDLRELLELEAIDEVRAELQRTAEGRRARTADQLHDLMRMLGDLSRDELAARVDPAGGPLDGVLDSWLGELAKTRRAVAFRIGDERRWISIEDTGDYVAVLGVQAPRGVPGVFLDASEAPLGRLLARRARTSTPFTTGEVARRWGIAAGAVEEELKRLHAGGTLLRGGFLPGGTEDEWCDPEVLRRLRRRTLSHLRREIEPADRSALARFLMGWHGLQQPPAGSVAATRDVVVQLEGIEATPAQWERDLVAPRLSSWRGQWLDELVKTGQLTWMGRGVRHGSIQVALFAAPHVELLAPPPEAMPDDDDCRTIAQWLGQRGATFLRDIVAGTGIPHERALVALWRLATVGWTTNDSWSTLRAGAATPAQLAKAAREADKLAAADAAGEGDDEQPAGAYGASRRTGLRTGGRRAHLRRARRGPAAGLPGEVDVRFQGRWSLLPLERAQEDERIAAVSDALLDTFGVVTRHSVQARPVPGGFAAVYRALAVQEEIGNVRRGWFVEGLGGAQFALPEAVDRLRAVREPTGGTPPVVVLRANDPAQPYGAVLAWPDHPTGASTPRRDASSYVVLRDGELLATVSPSGRRLVAWDRDAMPEIARALARVVDQRRVDRLAIEQLDDGAVDAETVRAFADTGFVRTPRGLRATPSTVAETRESLRASRRVRVGDVALPTHGALPTDPLP